VLFEIEATRKSHILLALAQLAEMFMWQETCPSKYKLGQRRKSGFYSSHFSAGGC